jgi:hypothetical protein
MLRLRIVAFEELISPKKTKVTTWQAAALLDVSHSTMHSWRVSNTLQLGNDEELNSFLSTPVGAEFLQHLMTALYMVTHHSRGGIRSMQEFLELSKLGSIVASSEGALQAYVVRCEEHIFGRGSEHS